MHIGQLFRVSVYLWPIIWFLSPRLPCPSTLPNMRVQLFSKMDYSPEAYGTALASPIMGWCPLLLDPQGAFLHVCNVSLAQRMGNM